MTAPDRRGRTETSNSVKAFVPFLALAAALGLTQCGEKAARAGKQGQPPSASADRTETAPRFEHDFPTALARAGKEGKPVIAIFSAAWCSPCQVMKNNVYPSGAVRPYHEKFVWAYLDADAAINQASMTKFGVNGIPHIEFLDSGGQSIGRQIGMVPAETFAKKLDEMFRKAGGPRAAAAGS